MKTLITLILFFCSHAYSLCEETTKGDPPPNPCLSLYSKEEVTVKPTKESFIQSCTTFCLSNSCRLKYANIGDISGVSKSVYKVCICE